MNEARRYPKRLIEVDLPIKRISARGRGTAPLSNLHTWWARRPLGVCRAVVAASLWPDPADPHCPDAFVEVAAAQMRLWAVRHLNKVSAASYPRFAAVSANSQPFEKPLDLRHALLDFIADFAAPENGTSQPYLETSRTITLAAHEALGGQPGVAPVVLDPFAGGGSFPLEALRVGAQAFAGDLNPLPFLLNKVALEYAPTHGADLAHQVRKWGEWLRVEAERELSSVYPKEADGSTPTVYLWARTIHCEGPGCGMELPVLRSSQIDASGPHPTFLVLRPVPERRTVEPQVVTGNGRDPIPAGTSRRSSVTCPFCNFTTPRQNVERQAQAGNLGEMLLAVAVDGRNGRTYRAPSKSDVDAIARAGQKLRDSSLERLLPTEALPYLRSIFNVHVYGLRQWRSLFSDRQLLYLATLVHLVTKLDSTRTGLGAAEARALRTVLALVVSKSAMLNCTLARWRSDRGRLEGAFAMQALPMVWDWGEVNPFNQSIMVFRDLVEATAGVIDFVASLEVPAGHAALSSAVSVPLPDDSASAVLTDPPYYDSIPYANLSDFFYVWLKRMLSADYPEAFAAVETPKATEIVQLAERNQLYAHKTKQFFEDQMVLALADARRVVSPDGLACIVFAHKTTSGWEALLSAVLKAGWVVTASWPIDTEMTTRFKAIGTASLNSSVHLVCRPRENPDGSLRGDMVGDWREVLEELPRRIHDWMPRLAKEGVVGADAIFACLGPALEVFSRYSKVEKANGEIVELPEYLEHVWAAVAREALSTVLQQGDSGSLEPDARLTVMWLWTLSGGTPRNAEQGEVEPEEDDDESTTRKIVAYMLEYDAARKIAQGLGASLDALDHVVEVKADKARLLGVAERASHLFGRESAPSVGKRVRRPKNQQISLFSEIDEAAAEQGWGDIGAPRAGTTTLDRIHQAMLLFGAGRGEALRRFLVEEGVGRQVQFWKLAQSFSALYPAGSDEKRWVDGVLARKKGLGF